MHKAWCIYETINTINGKYYRGYCRTSKILRKEYIGSGKLLWKAIDKYGWDAFSCSIVKTFDDKLEALQAELNFVVTNKVDPMSYNLVRGGNGKHSTYLTADHRQKIADGNRRRVISLESRHRMSIAQTGKIRSEEFKQKLRRPRGPYSIEHRNKIGAGNKGKTRSEEAKAKCRDFAKNRVYVQNGIVAKAIHISELTTYEQQGFSRGRKLINK